MAYLGNSAFNRANLHYAVKMFARASGGSFYFVFLLRAGVPLATTLLVEAAILAGRFLVRPVTLPLAKRIGLKPALIVGSVLMAAQYTILPTVHGVGLALAAVIAVSALGETFYWSCYHAYFAALGDAEHRGHQLGARQALAWLTSVVAPLLATWSLLAFGPWITFAGLGWCRRPH